MAKTSKGKAKRAGRKKASGRPAPKGKTVAKRTVKNRTSTRRAVAKRTVKRRAPVKRTAAKRTVKPGASAKPTAAKRSPIALPRTAAKSPKAAKLPASAIHRTAATRGPRKPGGPRAAPERDRRRLGPEYGGQSGDTEGLSREEIADSESVEELVEEGQAYEAGIVSGVENAPDADKGGVRTRQVPEDDVPQEYRDED